MLPIKKSMMEVGDYIEYIKNDIRCCGYITYIFPRGVIVDDFEDIIYLKQLKTWRRHH